MNFTLGEYALPPQRRADEYQLTAGGLTKETCAEDLFTLGIANDEGSESAPFPWLATHLRHLAGWYFLNLTGKFHQQCLPGKVGKTKGSPGKASRNHPSPPPDSNASFSF